MKKEQQSIGIKTAVIFAFQVVLIVFLLLYEVSDKLAAKELNKVPSLEIAFARFITGLIMHISMQSDIKSGLNMMKYALNHKWKFQNWYLACLSGFASASISIAVTIISYFIISFADDIIDIVKDFLAIQVISQLDDYFLSEQS